ncbi:MAG TPA: hypothetical protein VK483_10400 [Chitinophagaceae bacterium]|nr:hypothetical protein [Chitinophagaceae bacterium]
MRNTLFIFLFAVLSVNIASAQTVTLKQIGKETVMYSTTNIEWFNQHLYTLDNTKALYKTDLNTGVQTRLGNVVYKNTRYLFMVNAQLYCMEDDGSMNRIDINTGAWTVVSPIGTWNSINRVITLRNKFYTTENGVMYYHPTLNYRVRKQIGDADFYDLGYYCRADSALYTLIAGTLYNVNMNTGKWKMISPKKGWKFAKSLEVIGNKLYTIETPSSLFETDLATGAKKELDASQFMNAQIIFSDSGKLYGIFKGGVLYEIIIN